MALRALRLQFKLAVTLHELGRLNESEHVYRKTLEELQDVLSYTQVSFGS